MKRGSISILLLTLICTFSFAETMTITADNAVALALENNLSLQSEGINLNIRERGKDTAWNAFIPSLSASAGVVNTGPLFSDSSSIMNQATYQTERDWVVTGGFSAALPINAALGTGIRQTRIDYEAGLLSYEDARKQLNLNVRKTYFSLIALAADLELTRQNIEIAERRYEQARENYENGLISELEMLQAQVTVENTKPGYNTQLTSYENSLMNFKLLLGVPSSTELVLSENLDDITFFQADAEYLINAYSAGRMDVQQINKQIESLKNTRKLQGQYNRTPTLSLIADWSTSVADGFNSDVWQRNYWNDTGTVGVQLSVPLDGWIPNSSADVTLKDLDDQISQLELQRQQLFDASEIEITNLVMNLQNSQNTIETYSLNVNLAKKSFDLTTEAYNLGTRELLDVQTAQTEMLSASQNVLYEKYNYITTLLDLEYAINSDDISSVLEEK